MPEAALAHDSSSSLTFSPNQAQLAAAAGVDLVPDIEPPPFASAGNRTGM
jgi:hypothetical protein